MHTHPCICMPTYACIQHHHAHAHPHAHARARACAYAYVHVHRTSRRHCAHAHAHAHTCTSMHIHMHMQSCAQDVAEALCSRADDGLTPLHLHAHPHAHAIICTGRRGGIVLTRRRRPHSAAPPCTSTCTCNHVHRTSRRHCAHAQTTASLLCTSMHIHMHMQSYAQDVAEALCSRADDGLTPLHLAASCADSALMQVRTCACMCVYTTRAELC